jgi:fructokinase
LSAGRLYVGIEFGGSKILCRVIEDSGRVVTDRRFVTSTPTKAIDDVCGCIKRGIAHGSQIAGIGVASFGPIVVDPSSPDYGQLLATPKPGWSGFDIRSALLERLGAPIAIDTDVNAAALAEQTQGAGQGLRCVAYVTVGTGIGGGLATEGVLLKGALHPEIGHIRLRRRPGDHHLSSCPFHDDCAEGLAAGPAIGRRIGPLRTLAEVPDIFALIAEYLGELAAILVLAWSPQRMIVGGGVMRTAGLLDKVGDAMRASLGTYGAAIATTPGYIVAAQLPDSGLEGALIMARASAGAGQG